MSYKVRLWLMKLLQWMTARVDPRPVTPRIVSAVMTSATINTPSGRVNRDLSARVEAAMSQAVTDALASGVPIEDNAAIKRAMMMARKQVLAGN